MNREDIIRMAREAGAGLSTSVITHERSWVFLPDDLERFAALVAAAEREACAKVVEDTKEWKGGGWVSTLCRHTKKAIAAAIRARGNT